MTVDKTLSECATDFVAGLPAEERDDFRQELNKFIRWCGADRQICELAAIEVSNYAESVNSGSVDVAKVTTSVRAFLIYAKKEGLTSTNLSVHLRVKKTTSRRGSSVKGKPVTSTMTTEGYGELKAELADLKDERPKLSEDIRKAAADKDFRENAPLEAARERQGMVESRIRQLEAMLKASVVSDERPTDVVVAVGSKVTIHDLFDDERMCYTLVNPNEASPLKGKLSAASPIGKAMLGHKQGDVVEVAAPAKKLLYEIVLIEN